MDSQSYGSSVTIRQNAVTYRITDENSPNKEIMYGEAARPNRYYLRVGLSESVMVLNKMFAQNFGTEVIRVFK